MSCRALNSIRRGIFHQCNHISSRVSPITRHPPSPAPFSDSCQRRDELKPQPEQPMFGDLSPFSPSDVPLLKRLSHEEEDEEVDFLLLEHIQASNQARGQSFECAGHNAIGELWTAENDADDIWLFVRKVLMMNIPEGRAKLKLGVIMDMGLEMQIKEREKTLTSVYGPRDYDAIMKNIKSRSERRESVKMKTSSTEDSPSINLAIKGTEKASKTTKEVHAKKCWSPLAPWSASNWIARDLDTNRDELRDRYRKTGLSGDEIELKVAILEAAKRIWDGICESGRLDKDQMQMWRANFGDEEATAHKIPRVTVHKNLITRWVDDLIEDGLEEEFKKVQDQLRNSDHSLNETMKELARLKSQSQAITAIKNASAANGYPNGEMLEDLRKAGYSEEEAKYKLERYDFWHHLIAAAWAIAGGTTVFFVVPLLQDIQPSSEQDLENHSPNLREARHGETEIIEGETSDWFKEEKHSGWSSRRIGSGLQDRGLEPR